MSYASEQPSTLNQQTAAVAETGQLPPADDTRADVAGSPIPPGDSDGQVTGEVEGAPKNGAPKQDAPKCGAPRLNGNALRHGMDSKPEVVAMRFELGSLPDSMKRVEGDVYAFRRLLENAVMEAKGSISLIDAALIQTACRHERASRLALAWLREHEEELTHAERLAYNKAIADSSAARDKTLERLKLETDTATDPWTAFYGQRATLALTGDSALSSASSATSAENASNAAVGDGGSVGHAE